MKPVLFHFGSGRGLLQSLARNIGGDLGEMERRQFPDGESYIRMLNLVEGRDVIMLASLDDPDRKILPLLFAADAARKQGARSVGLAAPYLAYMRQDAAFQPGEAITSATFARLLSGAFDWLVTVDPHLHRYPNLNAVYSLPSIATTAAEPIANWIRDHVEKPCVIGPDEESAQWVKQIAALARAPFAIFRKTRHGDLEVTLDDQGSSLPTDSRPVIVDDIASSASTMVQAVKIVKERGHPAPFCLVVHALFAGDAYRNLIDAGPAKIVSTNSVLHPSNDIDVGAVLSEAVMECLN